MNDHHRYRTIINSVVIPRTSIENNHYASIDTLLKELKIVLRRVKGFSIPFSEELQVLERLYYKGKNQHRAAIFWRKLVEVRRHGARIREMNSQGLLEDFQHAFYVEDNNKANFNPPRGAWKQTPDRNTCIAVLKWLKSACLLIDQTRARFRLGYDAFIMQIRTAAFIPLAISLTSITARLDYLVVELREILALQWQVTTRLLQVLAGPNDSHHDDGLLSTDPFDISAKKTPCRVTQHVAREITEDLGDKVARNSHKHLASSGGPDLSVIPHCNTLIISPSSPDVENEAGAAEVAISKRKTLPIVSPLAETSMEFDESQWSEQDEGDGRKELKKSIPDNNRDEIDDIFGF